MCTPATMPLTPPPSLAPQVANFEYFLAVGSHYPPLHTNMHWVFVVAGEKCTPCASLEALLG
jgi:hypothetical protein